MEFVREAIQGALIFYSLRVVTLSVFIVLGICHVKKDKPNSDKIGLITIVMIIALIIYIFNIIIPFVADVISDNVVIEHGTYTNVLGEQSKSSSSISGIQGVELALADEAIHLTTVPWNEDIFPQGTYEVIAYYTPKSKMLLYMEILDLPLT